MANLKDIRTRIESVKTTRQVTSAMKMVSAAKLKKAQDSIMHIRPYVDKMNDILLDLFFSLENDTDFELSLQRDVKRILIVSITSNRGLCGAFNTNVVKEITEFVKKEYSTLYKDNNIDVVAIGKQGQKMLRSRDIICIEDFNHVYDDLKFSVVEPIAQNILDQFTSKRYDRVFIAYNEFVNAGVQIVKMQQFLPLELPKSSSITNSPNYIFEPNRFDIINELLPKTLKTLFFKIILESIASEHGARMTSMHKATDNASDLISELQLVYNKARQSAITNEILEIVGGAEALQK